MNIWEIHPALVHFPLALLFSSTVLEVFARLKKRERAARWAVGMLAAGLAFTPVVALAGVIAYFTVPEHTDGASFRMLVHAFLGVSASVFYGVVLLLRWRRRTEIARAGSVALSVVAALFLGATGALGGYLVYQDGVGVVPAAPPRLDVREDVF